MCKKVTLPFRNEEVFDFIIWGLSHPPSPHPSTFFLFLLLFRPVLFGLLRTNQSRIKRNRRILVAVVRRVLETNEKTLGQSPKSFSFFRSTRRFTVYLNVLEGEDFLLSCHRVVFDLLRNSVRFGLDYSHWGHPK